MPESHSRPRAARIARNPGLVFQVVPGCTQKPQASSGPYISKFPHSQIPTFPHFQISKFPNPQKLNLTDPCMILGDRVLITCPNVVFTCFPVASKRAVVSTPLNCVWLNTLYISHRSCSARREPPKGIRLKNVTSVLFVPGRR